MLGKMFCHNKQLFSKIINQALIILYLLNQWMYVRFYFQVKAQYAMCKKLKVPVLTYPESMKVALEMGPDCLRGFAKYSP